MTTYTDVSNVATALGLSLTAPEMTAATQRAIFNLSRLIPIHKGGNYTFAATVTVPDVIHKMDYAVRSPEAQVAREKPRYIPAFIESLDFFYDVRTYPEQTEILFTAKYPYENDINIEYTCYADPNEATTVETNDTYMQIIYLQMMEEETIKRATKGTVDYGNRLVNQKNPVPMQASFLSFLSKILEEEIETAIKYRKLREGYHVQRGEM